MNRLASVRSIDICVSDVRDDMEETFSALYKAGKPVLKRTEPKALSSPAWVW